MVYIFKVIHYSRWCVWEISKYMNLKSWNIWIWFCLFSYCPSFIMASSLKKTKIKVDLLADIDLLLMVEKGIRAGICHTIDRYPKSNNKYMKNYYRNKESSYLKCWDVKNLYGWAMSQNLPVNGLNGLKIFLDLMKIS